jgi:hypothetical protein
MVLLLSNQNIHRAREIGEVLGRELLPGRQQGLRSLWDGRKRPVSSRQHAAKWRNKRESAIERSQLNAKDHFFAAHWQSPMPMEERARFQGPTLMIRTILLLSFVGASVLLQPVSRRNPRARGVGWEAAARAKMTRPTSENRRPHILSQWAAVRIVSCR